MNLTKNYAEIYPYIAEGSLLDADSVPEEFKYDLSLAKAEAFC